METDCWIAAGGSVKLVLAGYYLQLPPTILSIQTAKGLSLTMMEKVVDSSEVTWVLTVQEETLCARPGPLGRSTQTS